MSRMGRYPPRQRSRALVVLVALILSACSGTVAGTPTPPAMATPAPTGTATRGSTATPPSATTSAPRATATVRDRGVTGHVAVGGEIAFTLLADFRLVAVRLGDGEVIAEASLASWSRSPGAAGQVMALGPDGRRLFVLVAGESGDPGLVVAVDVGTATVEAIHPLPREIAYRGLAAGSLTGRLYLFGNRPERGGPPPSPGPPRFGTPAADVVVTVLDPASGAVEATWTAREADGRDWRVYQGAVSGDERQIVVSYHGPDTTGIDRFDVAARARMPCEGEERPGRGCIGAHGGFRLTDDGLLAATGTGVILEYDREGRMRRGWDTGLDRTHLMEFAVDDRAGRLYAVGSCGYVAGFSAVALAGGGVPAGLTAAGEWQWRVPPAPPLVTADESCGERLAAGRETLIVASEGALLFIDTRTGQAVRRVATPAEPLDVSIAIAR